MTIYEKYGIDKTRLEFDYETNGGLSWEILPNGGKRVILPSTTDLCYLYKDCNVSVKDLVSLFQIGERKVYYLLKEAGLKKETSNRRKNLETALEEKYGVSNPKDASKGKQRQKFVEDFLKTNSLVFETPNKHITDFGVNYYLPEEHIGICLHKTTDAENLQKITKQAEEEGLRLFHLWDYEFDYQKKLVQKKLGLLVKPKTVIYARKTIVKRCSIQEKSLFLKENHIQGNDNAKLGYGLYYDDTLVSVMTFCKPRFNVSYEWELSRFCSKEGLKIIGGGSKLMAAFIKDYKPVKIITYSDFTLFSGKIYDKIGFKFLRLSPPNYKWVRGGEILPRYKTMKHKLIERGLEGSSETDIMVRNGYTKVLDCGNKVWEWCSYGNDYINEDAKRLNREYDIDPLRLSRDYVSDPIKLPNQRNLIAYPTKDDIEYLYNEKKMLLDDISTYFGLAKGGFIYILQKYGIKKTTEAKSNTQKRKNLMYSTFVLVDKSGNKLYEAMSYPPVLKGIRPDIVVCKDDIYDDYIVNNLSMDEVCEKYKISPKNVRVVLNDFLKVKKDPVKVKQVTARNLYKKYGVTNAFQLEENRLKAQQTLQERYGVDWYSKSSEFVKKIRATKLERYGRENYINSEKIVGILQQRRYSPYQLEVISSEEALRKCITENNIKNCQHLSKFLKMRYGTVRGAVNKFGCFDLFDYTKSHQEAEVQNFVKEQLPDEVLRFNARILEKKEIDIYIPKRNIGIEYNGALWHNANNHPMDYHRQKTDLANAKGIDLIHIFDYQWLYRFDVVEDVLKHRFGLTKNKLGARKCLIKSVDIDVFNDFVEDNSLYHAKPIRKKAIGLVYDDELVIAASYVKKGKTVEIFEIQGKVGMCVQGGISRLLKAIERETGVSKFKMNFNFTTFSGEAFKKLGWKFGKRLSPRRCWVRYRWFFYEDEITNEVKEELDLKDAFTLDELLDKLMGHQYNEVYDCGEIQITKVRK